MPGITISLESKQDPITAMAETGQEGFDPYLNCVLPCADKGGKVEKRISNREGYILGQQAGPNCRTQGFVLGCQLDVALTSVQTSQQFQNWTLQAK